MHKLRQYAPLFQFGEETFQMEGGAAEERDIYYRETTTSLFLRNSLYVSRTLYTAAVNHATVNKYK